MVIVGCLGQPGTFGWKVATDLYRDCELKYYPTHRQIIDAVVQRGVDRGVVARENMLDGAVTDTMDALAGGSIGIMMRLRGGKVSGLPNGPMVCAEVVLPVVQCLFMGSETRMDMILTIYSHRQAFGQCEKFLRVAYPNARQEPLDSTIAGVERMRQDPFSVAIAPLWAGQFYPDVKIVQGGIQDVSSNVTRFLLLGTSEKPSTGHDKTSLVLRGVRGDDKAGAFNAVLQVFASGLINLRSIESRPAKTQLGKYDFFMDADGHRQDYVLRLALEYLVASGCVTELIVLGSYPRASKD